MPDRWAAWLAERRFGGNEDARRESQGMFDEFRGRVLDGARIEEGDTVLDVGCGEGLTLSGTQIHPSCCSRVFVDQSAESVAPEASLVARRSSAPASKPGRGQIDELGVLGALN